MADLCVDSHVMHACKRQVPPLPVLTYQKYAALRFSKPTIFGSA